ncbi:MAG: pentapeptide repeat-containing protein [Anaerolineaceae bacterium]|nr:pentapeptide repeat-containing protein [Anaerolineaceae bacterium]
MTTREHTWQSFVNWWTTRKVAFALLTTSLLGGVLGYINQHSGVLIPIPFVTDFYANVSTELISIAITVLVIDTLNDRRAVQQEKVALILQMSSPINSVAREAIRMLRTRGWLTDGTLRGINLRWANLQDAYLEGANLPDTNLFRARLKGAHLQWSNLEGAKGLKDEQLVHLHNLRGAAMPDGTIYDGRYNLKRDLSWMQHSGVDRSDPEAVAGFYGVPVETYLSGQVWAQQHLDRLRHKGDIDLQWEDDNLTPSSQTLQPPLASQQQGHRLIYVLGGFIIGMLLTKLFGGQRVK